MCNISEVICLICLKFCRLLKVNKGISLVCKSRSQWTARRLVMLLKKREGECIFSFSPPFPLSLPSPPLPLFTGYKSRCCGNQNQNDCLLLKRQKGLLCKQKWCSKSNLKQYSLIVSECSVKFWRKIGYRYMVMVKLDINAHNFWHSDWNSIKGTFLDSSHQNLKKTRWWRHHDFILCWWDLKISNFVKLNIGYQSSKFQIPWLSGSSFM